MKVALDWLKELVDLKVSVDDLVHLIPMRIIGLKETNDSFLELDMKGYNRADLLSMRGVALEIAAMTDSKVNFSDVEDKDLIWVDKSLPKTEVVIEDEELCPVYCVAKIEGLQVGKASDEWVKKLNDSGVRSVNNVADVTNLIMLEYGQPMHSFDAEAVDGETIVVRTARAGEEIVTLDDKKRRLEETDLLIADPKKALGIAGVMGGKNSEITVKTTTILLEAAIFNPKSIRRTVTRLVLPSEASKRFQHGLTRKRLFQALDAAIRMYQDLGGKLVALNIVGDTEDQLKKIPLTLDRVNSLIGVNLTDSQVEEFLSKLNISLNKVEEGKWVVTPPFYRLDISMEEDLIEDIARVYGYENIAGKKLSENLPEKIDQSLFELLYNTKKILSEAGLTEVQSYSFYSTKILRAMGFDESQKEVLVHVANPISSETEYLREFIWPNLVEVIEKNMKYGYEDIAIFEVGKIYNPTKGKISTSAYSPQKEGGVRESYRLAIVLMNGSDNPIEELVQIVKQTLIQRHPELVSGSSALKIPKQVRNDNSKVVIEPGGMMEELKTIFHPNRYANIKLRDNVIGGVAEVHPRLLHAFGLEKRVAILEIALEPLLKNS